MELERLRRNANRWLVTLILSSVAMFGLIGVGLGLPRVGETIGPYCGPVVALWFWFSLIGAIGSGFAHEEAQKKQENTCHN